MLYIVLGMHKSGTTLIAKAIHTAGIPMIDYEETTQDYDEGNKYERKSFADLNKSLLGAADINTLRFEAPARPVEVPDAERERVGDLVEQLNATHESWGMKDPRLCLTYEQWRPMLPDHTIVAIYRHPAAVARHYLGRVGEREKETPEQQQEVLHLAVQRWIEYNQRLLRILRQSRQPRILLSYERLMESQTEWDRLGLVLGRPLPDVRDAQKYRNQGTWDKQYLHASLQTLRRTGRSAELLYLRLKLCRWRLLMRVGRTHPKRLPTQERQVAGHDAT